MLIVFSFKGSLQTRLQLLDFML